MSPCCCLHMNDQLTGIQFWGCNLFPLGFCLNVLPSEVQCAVPSSPRAPVFYLPLHVTSCFCLCACRFHPGISKMPSCYFKVLIFFLSALQLGRSLIHCFIYSFFQMCWCSVPARHSGGWWVRREKPGTAALRDEKIDKKIKQHLGVGICWETDLAKTHWVWGVGLREEKPSYRRWGLIWDLKYA